MKLFRRLVTLWAFSLIGSVLIFAVTVVIMLAFIRSVQEYAKDPSREPPSDTLVKMSRPFVWVATQQPAIEFTKFIPGFRWIESSADDINRIYSEGGRAVSVGIDVLAQVRSESLFESPGQIDPEILGHLRGSVGQLNRSVSQIPMLSDVLSRLPDFLGKKLGDSLEVIELYQIERTVRGGVAALNTGVDFVLDAGDAEVFVAVTNPAEKRGVQGIIGQYAVLRVRDGKITVSQSGSNTDLVDPKELPEGLSEGYTSLLGETNVEWQNMTMSPFAPDAAQQIAAAWSAQSGQEVDAVVLLDTVALGAAVSATDGVVVTRSGEELTDGMAIAQYLSNGIYFDFPEDNVARKEFQTQLEQFLISGILERPLDVERLAREIAPHLGDGRVFMWMADAERQSTLEETFIAGGVESMGDNAIWLGMVNFTGNKMDFYVLPKVEAKVCGEDITVRIRFENSAVSGAQYPDYVTRRLDQSGSSSSPASALGVTVLVSHQGLKTVTSRHKTYSSSDAFSLAGVPAFQFMAEIGPGQVSEIEVDLSGGRLPDVLVSPFATDVDFRVTSCP